MQLIVNNSEPNLSKLPAVDREFYQQSAEYFTNKRGHLIKAGFEVHETSPEIKSFQHQDVKHQIDYLYELCVIQLLSQQSTTGEFCQASIPHSYHKPNQRKKFAEFSPDGVCLDKLGTPIFTTEIKHTKNFYSARNKAEKNLLCHPYVLSRIFGKVVRSTAIYVLKELEKTNKKANIVEANQMLASLEKMFKSFHHPFVFVSAIEIGRNTLSLAQKPGNKVYQAVHQELNNGERSNELLEKLEKINKGY